MAKKVSDGLNYAEDSAGTFGSGWQPQRYLGPTSDRGTDYPVAASKFDSIGAPTVKGGKVLYPQAGRRLPNGSIETPEQAQARILGTSKVSPGQTVQQMQAQNDFDKRMGFQPTHSDEDIKRISDYVAPSKNPQASTTAPVLKNSSGDVVGVKSPLDTLNNPPSIAGEPLPSATTPLLGVPTGQEVQPSGAVKAGAATRSAVESIRNPVSGFESFQPAYAPEKPIYNVPAALGRGWQAVKRVANTISQGAQGFASGFSSGGDKVAAGVSNSSAAQFQKPTSANPNPVTPTTPVANIDKSTESLGRFGMSDDEFNRRKYAFAGF